MDFKTLFKKNQDSLLVFFGLFFTVLALIGFYNALTGQKEIGELKVEKVPLEALKAPPESPQSAILTIVGNRSSKIYHYDFCVGAKNMKEENKIFFASIEEAKSAGFRAAKNCPGLK